MRAAAFGVMRSEPSEKNLDQIADIVKEWPIIIQGALGSGLFWLLLTLLQKLSSIVTLKLSQLSKTRELEELKTELLKIQMNEMAGIERLHFAAPLLFRASRPFFKAILWLVMGLLFGSIDPLFGVIGYVGSIYFLLEALNVLSKYEINEDLSEHKISVKERISELENDS